MTGSIGSLRGADGPTSVCEAPELGVQIVSACALIFGCLFMLWQVRRAHQLAQQSALDHDHETEHHEEDTSVCGCLACCGGDDDHYDDHEHESERDQQHQHDSHSDDAYNKLDRDAELTNEATDRHRVGAESQHHDDDDHDGDFNHAHGHHALAVQAADESSCLPALCQPQLMIFPLYYTFMKIAAFVLLVRGLLIGIGSSSVYYSVASLLLVNPMVCDPSFSFSPTFHCCIFVFIQCVALYI